jgi:uncharacterized protein (TIGR03435 family)
LTLAKDGPKLHPTHEGSCVVTDINHPRATGNPSPVCGTPKVNPGGEIVNVDIPGATIANLCAQLSMVMDREVIDRTGIAGRFDIHLEVTPAELHPKFVAGRTAEQNAAATDNADGPSISTALRQQLGLKLETGRGPVQVIVVDHIERPSEN